MTRRMLVALPVGALVAQTDKLQALRAGREITVAGVRVKFVEHDGVLSLLVIADRTDAYKVLIEVFHNTESVLDGGPVKLVLLAALLDITLVHGATTLSDRVPISLAALHSIRVRLYKELANEVIR